MSINNDGRNVIPVANSDGRCLLENWIEERATKYLQPDNLDGYITNRMELLKHGNAGILTTNNEAPVSGRTDYRDNYKMPTGPGVRMKGKRQELLEKYIWSKYGDEIDRELTAPPEPTDFRSTKMVDYDRPEFEEKMGQLPPPSKVHDYKLDQPATFWTEHKDRITGMSNVKMGNTPFRRNSAFSTPIFLSWDPTLPYDPEDYPKS